MKTGKTIHGTANLAFDTIEATTHIIEGMYRNIAATPWPLQETPTGPAKGIAGFVHRAIRKANALTRHGTNRVLEHIAPELDRTSSPGPHREAIISAINGVCGDHLAHTGNTLAISMRLRVLLAPRDSKQEAQQIPLANLFEVHRRSVEIHPQPDALREDDFIPGRRLLVLAHGLCMNDREWTSHQQNHADALAEHGGYTPIYVLYNSGRHVSTNGRELCEQLTGLLATWPVPVDSITLIGFSMGGLLTRSAMQTAKNENHPWLEKVDKSVYVGTPHHGAVMERGGFWLQKSFTYSPYTAPLSALGRVRSAGITDLRHGNVTDDDWQHHDEHEDHTDRRKPIELADGIKHYAIAATLSRRSGERIGRLLGDGLVHPSSATGKHRSEDRHLYFPNDHIKIFYDLGHLAMLRDSRVQEQLLKWL